MIEIAKAYNLNLYECLKFLLEHRPNKGTSDDDTENIVPWNGNHSNLVVIKWGEMLAFGNSSDGILDKFR